MPSNMEFKTVLSKRNQKESKLNDCKVLEQTRSSYNKLDSNVVLPEEGQAQKGRKENSLKIHTYLAFMFQNIKGKYTKASNTQGK